MSKGLPDVPLSTEAASLLAELLPKIREKLLEAARIPVSVLIWGGGLESDSPLARARLNLREILRRDGHAACFSEELCDVNGDTSLRLQQIAQAQLFDLIISLPATMGSVGEAHDFAADRRVHGKLLLFANATHMSGYSPKSLAAISNVLSCRIEYYPDEHDLSIIQDVTMIEVQRIREMKWILAGRM